MVFEQKSRTESNITRKKHKVVYITLKEDKN